MLQFDADKHEYRLDGAVVPSVTQVTDGLLTDLSMVPPDILRRAAEFGQAVHAACEYDDDGTLDEDSLDVSLLPYLAGYRKFKAEAKPEVLANELKVYSRKYGFAGTLDRVMRFGRGLPRCLVDLKTNTQLLPAVGPQTAAYQLAWEEMGNPALTKRFALQLLPNDYRLEPLTDPMDRHVFLSCLTVARWRKTHGIQ